MALSDFNESLGLIDLLVSGAHDSLWADLRRLWQDLAQAHQEHTIDPQILQSACIALAKFTRNIVAGVQANQINAFVNEPQIRSLLHHYTSWSTPSTIPARILTQALSNIVTSNEDLLDNLWDLYLNLPEDEVVIIRLLGSPDEKTILITLIFILNCVHQCKKRMYSMVSSKIGVRIAIRLLDKMVVLHEAEEGSDGAKAFDVGYAIISEIIEMGLLPDLYRNFAMLNEIIIPHQTTLLKFLDSYLQSLPLISDVQVQEILRIHESLSSFLAKRFFSLSHYAQKAILKSLGMTYKPKTGDNLFSPVSSDSESELGEPSSSDKTLALQQINLVLVKVCEALVLVTQCMVTVSLQSESQRDLLEREDSTLEEQTDVKSFFNRKKYEEVGMVESLIDLLTLLDIFLPRINFGKPVHRLGMPEEPKVEGVDTSTGFSYLKRDLVRLLGVLCHGVTSVQDRVREAGGLPVIMNMCVIDERNPHLREHAIFTMRNLLQNNPENQKFVDSVKPVRRWSAARQALRQPVQP